MFKEISMFNRKKIHAHESSWQMIIRRLLMTYARCRGGVRRHRDRRRWIRARGRSRNATPDVIVTDIAMPASTALQLQARSCGESSAHRVCVRTQRLEIVQKALVTGVLVTAKLYGG
jgi:hypothetical protein